MPDGFAHCENLVRAGDKDRWLASLFAPGERRAHLYALYAFNLEVARVRELAREPMAGEIRLQWWREVIAGTRPGEAAAHPVAAVLLETIARYGLPVQTFLDLIEARAFDLYNDPMPTLDAFAGYGRRGETKNKRENEKLFHGLTGTISAVRPVLGLSAGR